MSKSSLYAQQIRKFLGSNSSGQVMVTYALALIPLVTAVGAAIDYGVASKTKGQLDAIADMAVLSSVSQVGMQSDENSSQAYISDLFRSQTATVSGTNLSSVGTNVTDVLAGRTAALTYQAAVKTHFLNVAGLNQVTVSGSSTASNLPPQYIDFYVLIDNTPSMGIGATQNDINTLMNITQNYYPSTSSAYNCGFACHDLSGAEDTYTLARTNNVTMRIDEVRTALQNVLGTIQSAEILPSQYRVAIYTFGAQSQAGLQTIQTLTSNLGAAGAAASAIDLMSIPYQTSGGDADSSFGNILSSMSVLLPTQPGDGTSGNPLKYLFIVTDGLVDRLNTGPVCTGQTTTTTDSNTQVLYGRCLEPLITSYCTAIKNQGINIIVLYTTYLPLPTNAFYNDWIAPFMGQVPGALQSCASPNLYAEVNPLNVRSSIATAMSGLFSKSVQVPRLVR